MSEDISNRNEKIEILHGTENIIDRTLRDLVDVRQTFDNCTDYTGPSVSINLFGMHVLHLNRKE
jgi:hypothetical protein